MGYISLLAVAVIFGFFAVLIKYSSLMFGDITQVIARNVIALIILIPIIFYRQISMVFERTDLRWLILYSSLTTISFATITLAILSVDVKDVLAVRYVTSITLGFLIGKMLFSEIRTALDFIALLLALCGLFVFAWPLEQFFSLGALYASVAASTMLLANGIIKHISQPPETIMFFEFTFISLALSMFLLVSGGSMVVTINTFGLIAVLLFGLLLVLVTYLLVYGFRNSEFHFANIVLASEIPFGLLFGYFLLQQTINNQELIGITLVFCAAILPNIFRFIIKK